MKVTLYMAVSIDGFIAKKDGDSDWVSEVDSVIFNQQIKDKGCIAVGRKTYEQFYGELYPVDGITNIVLTKETDKISDQDYVHFVNSANEAIKKAEENSHDQILLIGGGEVNGAFLNVNLIDEIILSVHPLILSDGIKIFENTLQNVNLELLRVKELDEGLVQMYYQVV